MSVVQHVDDILRAQLCQGPLKGTRIPVTFDTPGPQWVAHCDSPCVNLFLQGCGGPESGAWPDACGPRWARLHAQRSTWW